MQSYTGLGLDLKHLYWSNQALYTVFIVLHCYIQVAGAAFRSPLLKCLLNLTLNKKSSSHTLQFASKYHVFLNSLWAQIWDHTHHILGPAAIYYTVVGLEKK